MILAILLLLLFNRHCQAPEGGIPNNDDDRQGKEIYPDGSKWISHQEHSRLSQDGRELLSDRRDLEKEEDQGVKTLELSIDKAHSLVKKYERDHDAGGFPLLGLPQPVSRIFGGTRAPRNRYPYMAAVYIRRPADGVLVQKCGGTLIAPDVVLTAAHCNPSTDVVRLGIHHLFDPTENFETFEVMGREIHPDFVQKSFLNDFMLLKLDGRSEKTPIKLHSMEYSDRNMTVPFTSLTVMGWGKRMLNHTSSMSDLQEAEVKLWATPDCKANYGGNRIGKQTMCASIAGVTDACTGDSGGPLIVKEASDTDVQVGVTSWGNDCGLPPYPGVYARMSFAFEWINMTLCTLSPEYCGKIAAPPPQMIPNAGDPEDDGQECKDAVGKFLVIDERRNKRFRRTCEWVKQNEEKACRLFHEYCPETCIGYFSCSSKAEE